MYCKRRSWLLGSRVLRQGLGEKLQGFALRALNLGRLGEVQRFEVLDRVAEGFI